ncbi:hypothetical protein [Thiofilum flexile]|uniref:hypothetical protein n=1 Tax=Thiofilum flexile TaxID=125627 RepID=UPI00036C9041|nr:hypothetical protein [Thiofilum flexile]
MTLKAIPPDPDLLTSNPKQADLPPVAGWGMMRGIIAAAAILIWILLILLPGMDDINNLDQLALHLPLVVTGLGLLGGIMAAYSLKADGHLIWFTATLLLLAGWML